MDAEIEHDIATLRSLILAIIADTEKRFASHMAQHGLTPPQFFVLKTLSEHDGQCPIGQIAHEHHLTNATLTGLVKRLESMDPPLVRRERRESDRRSVMVVLTEAGQERYKAVEDSLLGQLRLVLGLLSKEDRKDIIQKVKLYVHFVMQMFPVDAIHME